MFALASQATIAPIAAPLRAHKAPKTALRRAAVRVNASPDAKSDDDRAMFSRRQLGLGSAALASLMATDMTVVNPAMAKKIISGKQDLPDIADLVMVFHGLGSYTYEKWYKEVFSPFEAGLHSGEVGGPEVGPAFAKVVNLTILRGRNPDAPGGETVAVQMFVLNENADPAAKGALTAIQKFFVDTGPGANPFWAEGRDAGWVGTDLTQWSASVGFIRGANPKTGYPDDWKKGTGVGVYDFGLKIPYEEWVPQFTSPESDQLHDAAGVFFSAVGPDEKGTEHQSKYRSVQVIHAHKNLKQARAFLDRVVKADAPPFDQIKDILDNPEAIALEVVSDTFFPEYFPESLFPNPLLNA